MLLTPQHRRSTRSRKAPKRYEDEKFVSGKYDRYSSNYNGRFKKNSIVSDRQDADNYYRNEKGERLGSIHTYKKNYFDALKGEFYYEKIIPIDFLETLFAFTCYWRKKKLILPGDIVNYIGSYLNFKEIEENIAKDDEFIVSDNEYVDIEYEEDDFIKEASYYETDEDEEWSQYINISDESDDESEDESNDKRIKWKCGLQRVV